MSAVYRCLHRYVCLRPYLPAKKYDMVSADDEEPHPRPREVGTSQERQCRICLASDDEADLISPCLCAGSVRWVHRACLDEWRAQEVRPNAFERCELCHFPYVTQRLERPLSAKLRVYLLVVRDLCAIFGAVQLVILLQASVLRAIDSHGKLAARLPYRLGVTHPFLAAYLVSLVLVLALIGLVGMCVACTAHDAPLCLYDPWLSASTGDCLFAGCEAGEAGAACALVMACVIVVLALIGSCFFSSVVFSYVVRRHVDLSQRRDEARHVVVLDLAARPEVAAVARTCRANSAPPMPIAARGAELV
jgi:hypothetical protein